MGEQSARQARPSSRTAGESWRRGQRGPVAQGGGPPCARVG